MNSELRESAMTAEMEAIKLEDHHILWDVKVLSEVLGMGRSSIYTAMKSDGLPKPIRVGARASRWRKSDILKWIDSRPQGLEHEVQ